MACKLPGYCGGMVICAWCPAAERATGEGCIRFLWLGAVEQQHKLVPNKQLLVVYHYLNLKH